jgi:hypothetical protein
MLAERDQAASQLAHRVLGSLDGRSEVQPYQQPHPFGKLRHF